MSTMPEISIYENSQLEMSKNHVRATAQIGDVSFKSHVPVLEQFEKCSLKLRVLAANFRHVSATLTNG